MTTPQILTNQPPKGTYDWLPEEFAIRKYIFDNWRKVCQRFGYQEYLTPLVEFADTYRAKSGEDVGGPELTVFEDRGGRELAIRPEMTPSVTRLVSRVYAQTPKPIRFFSIANFYRNEKPQRGRNREFWQLNFDIFGENSSLADLEILQMALETMLSFNPPEGSFTLYLNNRQLIDSILPKTSNLTELLRLIDKSAKISAAAFQEGLQKIGLSDEEISKLILTLNSDSLEKLASVMPEAINSEGFKQTKLLFSQLEQLGYSKLIKYNPNIMRGFDYYDGMVFEVFDNNPENSRSMFGGGRYNGLATIFGSESFPAVGCAPGDETTKLFLESWNLIPKLEVVPTKVLVTVFSPDLLSKSLELSANLRLQGIPTELFSNSETKLDKQLKYASQKGIPYVAILGPEEMESNAIVVKNMSQGTQTKESLAKVISLLTESQ